MTKTETVKIETPIALIIDHATGETIERELTAEELTEIQQLKNETDLRHKAMQEAYEQANG